MTPLLTFCLLLADPSVAGLLEHKALEEIRAVENRIDGVLGVAALDLTSGRTLTLHAGTLFPQASSIKIPILITLFRAARTGAFGLGDTLTLTPKEAVGGSGRLAARLQDGPLTLSVRELAAAMIESSDNTATNRLIALVGRENVNRTLDELGFPQTRLLRVMMDSAAAERDQENISTPLEMVRLMEAIWRRRAADPDSCREMLEILKLPAGAIRAAVPAGVEVAAKPGSIEGVHCETGIVFLNRRPFALAVMTAYLDRSRNPVGEVAAILYNYFEKLANSNSYGRRLPSER